MSDRPGARSDGRGGKPPGQDGLGLLLSALGGLFTVSLLLALWGWESRGGPWTWPVEELLAWLGPWAALLFSSGLAILGTVLFLQRQSPPPVRPLAALVGAALGLSLLLGAFGGERGGLVGSAFPSVLGGLSGSLFAGGLGAVTLLLALALASGPRSRGLQPVKGRRIELPTSQESASGVSAAEAALLVNEPPSRTAVSPLRKPSLPPRRESYAPRDEALRPYSLPSPPAPASLRRGPVAAPVPAGERADEDLAATQPPATPRVPPRGEPRRGGTGASGQALGAPAKNSIEAPPVPSWEDQALDAAPPKVEAEADPATDSGSEPLEPPAASWEQIGLFDEEEEIEDGADSSTRVETQVSAELPVAEATLDSAGAILDQAAELASPPGGAWEESESSEDPFASDLPPLAIRGPSSPIQVEIPPSPRDATADEEAAADAEDTVLTPLQPGAAPAARFDAGDETSWRELVFAAGCLIVEQDRVAVSMLQRRFGIDFEQACRVLDELQQAGLIGPYMGGRTRDILLSREEWLAQAPNAT